MLNIDKIRDNLITNYHDKHQIKIQSLHRRRQTRNTLLSTLPPQNNETHQHQNAYPPRAMEFRGRKAGPGERQPGYTAPLPADHQPGFGDTEEYNRQTGGIPPRVQPGRHHRAVLFQALGNKFLEIYSRRHPGSDPERQTGHSPQQKKGSQQLLLLPQRK